MLLKTLSCIHGRLDLQHRKLALQQWNLGGNSRQMNLWYLITLPPLLKEQDFLYIQSVNCQCLMLLLMSLFTFTDGCTSVTQIHMVHKFCPCIRNICPIMKKYWQPSFSLQSSASWSNKQGLSTTHIHPPVKTSSSTLAILLKTKKFHKKLIEKHILANVTTARSLNKWLLHRGFKF